MTIIYERIINWCTLHHISLYAIEKKTHLTRGSVSKWKDSIPSGDKILRVARFLDVSADYLMGYTDNPHSHKNNPQDLAAAAGELAELMEETKQSAAKTAERLEKLLKAHNIDPAPGEAEADPTKE